MLCVIAHVVCDVFVLYGCMCMCVMCVFDSVHVVVIYV